MTRDGKASSEGFAHGRVLAELEAIFQSAEFERSPVMRRLLAFLVRTTLAGGGDELKAYAVAVDGLGRDPDFDSQSDSYPRVQVGRLRKMLDSYYAQAPSSDGVRLHIKHGGYRVHFTQAEGEGVARAQATAANHGEARSAAAAPAVKPKTIITAPWPAQLTRPRLFMGLVALALLAAAIAAAWWLGAGAGKTTRPTPVLEIRRITSVGSPDATALARRAEAMLGVALHRSWIVRVTTPETKGFGATPSQPSYRLTGQVNAGPGYNGRRLFLTLWDLEEGAQLWSETVQLPDDDGTLLNVMGPVISTLIQPFGVIATDQRAKRPTGERSTYACLLDYDRYFRDRDPALQQRVRSCVSDAARREPMNASVLAAASFLEFDFTLGGGTPEAHQRGTELARRAVATDPYNADAQVADARAAFIAGQCRRGKDIGARAIALNRFNPDNLGLLGFLLFQCDDPEAEPLLESARALDNELPPFYTVAQLLALIEQGRNEDAVRIADTIRPPGQGMSGQYELVRVIAEAARGNIDASRRHWQRVVSIRKIKSDAPDSILSQYFYSPRFRAKVLRYLEQQGIVGPAPQPS
ncbi:hypothetical protein [Sphingomonas cavernae]|uniref:OmpR/PhoB-type domain-containing protein n=1 Tax=Sphingomonas cavernae TaxID=2320861 RepID=A0A418WS80_9SPHN|nr:hypothetical protein [Sphingomonas cavernae]RJF94113.1 hypothetical protein D3876_07615 [Sphingomonas cavernae]